jgi:RimJ/RimL family protein N-acetyltransferase
MKFTLESERLLLRNLKESDLDSFLSYRSLPGVAKYQMFEPYTREKALSFILSQKDAQFGVAGKWLQLGIVLKSEDKLVGDCGIHTLDNVPQTAEIGCTLSPSYQSKGFAKEAVFAVMKYLFEEAGIHRIVETTDAENISSIRLLESLGFRKEAHFIENIFFKGKWGSEYQYAMLAREWEKMNPARAEGASC